MRIRNRVAVVAGALGMVAFGLSGCANTAAVADEGAHPEYAASADQAGGDARWAGRPR